VDAARYPLDQSQPQTYYLAAGPSGSGAPSQNDGRLEARRPDDGSGSDQLAFSGATSPCSRSSEQWGAGTLQLALELGQLPPDPCAQDDRSVQVGPSALTYTTGPLDHAVALAGPIDVTLFARSTASDSEWVARIEDVAPDGSSLPLASGALLGSFRALDPANTWLTSDGLPLLPYHPYTEASALPVVPGQLTRYDIEVFPTFARVAAGHRLRLTLTTSDTPHLLPTVPELERLAGGIYSLQRNAAAASYVELPVAPDAFASGSLRIPAPRPAGRCLARRRVAIDLGLSRLRLRNLVVRVNGRRARLLEGAHPRAVIDLRTFHRSTIRVVLSGRTARGRRYRRIRLYVLCSARSAGRGGAQAAAD
jgi:putative CocE/NonD family hydrolase